MLPEIYFLKYAFPCARVLVDFRKTINEEEYERLRQAVEKDTALPREYLERIFPKAIAGMRKISDDYWNIRTIQEYFCRRHEEALSPDLPPMLKRLCIVKPGRFEKKVDGHFRVDLGNGDIRIVAPLYKDAKVGDTAMIHYGYAVEKI